VRRESFTIETIPARLAEVGDLWATLRTAKGVDLSRALRYTGPVKASHTKIRSSS
jgi:DNA primase